MPSDQVSEPPGDSGTPIPASAFHCPDVVTRATDLVGVATALTVEAEHRLIDWEALRELAATDILSTQYGSRYYVDLERASDGFSLASLDLAVFPADDIAHLEWIWVLDGLQRNGLASSLRGHALSVVADHATMITSTPISDAGIALAQSQGFSRVDCKDALSSHWFTASPATLTLEHDCE